MFGKLNFIQKLWGLRKSTRDFFFSLFLFPTLAATQYSPLTKQFLHFHSPSSLEGCSLSLDLSLFRFSGAIGPPVFNPSNILRRKFILAGQQSPFFCLHWRAAGSLFAIKILRWKSQENRSRCGVVPHTFINI